MIYAMRKPTYQQPLQNMQHPDSQAHENRERYMAQSLLIGILHENYLPTLQEAKDINAWAARGVGETQQ